MLSICFILDHCRRVKRRKLLLKLEEEAEQRDNQETGNGPQMLGDYEMREVFFRSMNKPRHNAVSMNGTIPRYDTDRDSLEGDEPNHSSILVNDRQPLLTASMVSIGERNGIYSERNGMIADRNELRKSSTSMGSAGLPPPPKELLEDSPLSLTPREPTPLDDEDSDSSTISLRPPPGFSDSDDDHQDTDHGRPAVVITSPTPTNSSLGSSTQTGSLQGTLPRSSPVNVLPNRRVPIAKKLNNEVVVEHVMIKRPDGSHNLLQNSVSVQTNDLKQPDLYFGKINNPGHVTMNPGSMSLKQSYYSNRDHLIRVSPFLDSPDTYLKADLPSELGETDSYNIENETCKTPRQIPAVDFVDSVAPVDQCEVKSALLCERQGKWDSDRARYVSSSDDTEAASSADNETPVSTASSAASSTLQTRPQKKGRLWIIRSHKSLDSGLWGTDDNRHESDRFGTPDARVDNPNVPVTKEEELPLLLDTSADSMDTSNKYMPTLNQASSHRVMKLSNSDSENSVSSSNTPRTNNKQAGNKHIFAVPKHRCGSGHEHSCVCVPLRTGSNSFTCQCLEKAKYGSLSCCVEDCAELKEHTGTPYSPQPRAKSNTLGGQGTKKRCSSLLRSPSLRDENDDKGTETKNELNEKRLTEESGYQSMGSFSANGEDPAPRGQKVSNVVDGSATTPRLPSKSNIKSQSSVNVMSLDRIPNRSKRFKNTGAPEPKLIPVIVHSSKSRNGKKPRFEGQYPVDIRPSESTSEDTDHKDNIKVVVRSKSPRIRRGRSLERSDSLDKSDIKQPDKLPKKRPQEHNTIVRDPLKNGNIRLSPICEDLAKDGSPTSSSRASPRVPGKLPRFVQIVQTLDVNQNKKVNKV